MPGNILLEFEHGFMVSLRCAVNLKVGLFLFAKNVYILSRKSRNNSTVVLHPDCKLSLVNGILFSQEGKFLRVLVMFCLPARTISCIIIPGIELSRAF